MTQPPKSRRRAPYHHGNLPTALAAAARELIEQEGADALTLRAVAKRVGVTHAAPYRHFKDKQALLDAVAERGRQELADALSAAVAGADTAQDALECCGRRYLVFSREHTALFRLMFGCPPSTTHAGGGDLLLRRCFADAFRAANGGKTLAKVDADSSAGAVWAIWHGLAMLAIDERVGDLDAVTDAAAQACGLMIKREVAVPPRSTLRPNEDQHDKHGDAVD